MVKRGQTVKSEEIDMPMKMSKGITMQRYNPCNPDLEKIMNSQEYQFEDLWHTDFYDILNVLKPGAVKHGSRNWEAGNKGSKSNFKEMHDSMFHHLAHSYSAGCNTRDRYDIETEQDHLLHLATRALMCYSLIKRGKYNES